MERKHSNYVVQFQKISILMEGFLFCTSPLSPHKFQFSVSYFASKILAFKTPLPLEISDDLPWCGYYGCFLELHIKHLNCSNVITLKYHGFLLCTLGK